MFENPTIDYAWIVFWVFALNSIGPVCVLFSLLITVVPAFATVPLCVQYWVISESLFYLGTILYLKFYLQRPALHPALHLKEERNRLFDLCEESTEDYKSYVEKWFVGTSIDLIKRDNIKEFFRWAFLNTAINDPEYDGEMEGYVTRLESKLGTNFEPGRADVKCTRLTIDNVDALHRSLLWYACIFIVDVLTYTYLRFHQFQLYRTSVTKSLAILPPRVHVLSTPHRSSSPDLSYWFHSHSSEKHLPILFLHGIGVGLYPYMEFLKELNEAQTDGDIGIIAPEILSVSSRITSSVLRKEEMCRQIRIILDNHRFERFVLASHSYGSVITAHILKDPHLAGRISSVVLIDPISILLHQPDVAYNFTVRKPKLAKEWLLWYFGSKDIGVAHTLSRTFFWFENILWEEDILQHRTTVFLAEKDSIINAPQVRTHLQRAGAHELEIATMSGKLRIPETPSCDDGLSIAWCKSLNHGELFDSQLDLSNTFVDVQGMFGQYRDRKEVSTSPSSGPGIQTWKKHPSTAVPKFGNIRGVKDFNAEDPSTLVFLLLSYAHCLNPTNGTCDIPARAHARPYPHSAVQQATMATRSSKRQKTADDMPYELIYWPSIPGRGEHIRLAFEEAGAAYTDTAQVEKGVNSVFAQISDKNVGDDSNPPPLAPPVLKHGDLTISQTPNILLYLGSKLGLVPDSDPNAVYHVNALTLTALDGLSNEPHDVHHPIASGAYYEDQKEEALKKAADYRTVRLPKFLGYFERVLSGGASGGGEYLYGGQLTYADLVLFQTLDGVTHAFPKCLKTARESGKYEKVFALYDRVKGREKIKAYLASERRQKYSMGIYRHYPELDAE